MKVLVPLGVALLLAGCSSTSTSTPPTETSSVAVASVAPSETEAASPSEAPSSTDAAPLGPNADDPKVCVALWSSDFPALLGPVEDPTVNSTFVTWAEYFNRLAAYLDARMGTYEAAVQSEGAASQKAEEEALAGVKNMLAAAVEGSSMTSSDPPTLEDIDELARLVLAYVEAAQQACPSSVESATWPPGSF